MNGWHDGWEVAPMTGDLCVICHCGIEQTATLVEPRFDGRGRSPVWRDENWCFLSARWWRPIDSTKNA